MATSEFAPRQEKERIVDASLRIGFSFRLRAGQLHVRERVRCCDLFRFFLGRFRLLLRARSNRLRTCWNRERIGFRSALADSAQIDSCANSDSHSASATSVTMAMLFAGLMGLRLVRRRLGFARLRFCGRISLGLWLWRVRLELTERVIRADENSPGDSDEEKGGTHGRRERTARRSIPTIYQIACTWLFGERSERQKKCLSIRHNDLELFISSENRLRPIDLRVRVTSLRAKYLVQINANARAAVAARAGLWTD